MNIGISGINGRVGKILSETLVEDSADDSQFKLIKGLGRTPSRESIPPICDDVTSFLDGLDLVIDFSLPDNTVALVREAAKCGVSIVTGTTGLDDRQMNILEGAAKDTPILHAGNMSLGVNLLCSLVEQASERLSLDYDIEVTETHHRMKRDAPSGTALMLGKSAAGGRGQDHDAVAVFGREGNDALRQNGEIGYAVRRGGGVIGAHEVSFFGSSEVLSLSHHAEDRALFAEGAIFAARWLTKQRAGRLYSMKDALSL